MVLLLFLCVYFLFVSWLFEYLLNNYLDTLIFICVKLHYLAICSYSFFNYVRSLMFKALQPIVVAVSFRIILKFDDIWVYYR